MNTTSSFPKKYGAVKLLSGLGVMLLGMFWVLGSLTISKLGMTGALMFLALPIGVALMMYLWSFPKAGIWLSLIMGFLISGISRYINAPWGLSIDIFLTLSLLIVLINKAIRVRWQNANTDIVIFSLVWMGYLVLEIFNPAGNGFEAWFYAMRGIGFYQALAVPIVYLLFREEKDFHTFLNLLILLSLLGTAWGFRQQIFGVDAAEYRWLWDEEHHEEHVLHGVLRVFSFYSDAGQFGASQAMMALLTGILALGPFSLKRRILYWILAIVFFLGFAISGTRGALAVPLFGGLAYLVTTKNFKVLFAGLSAMILVFVILKYTFLFQGVEQVRRMRTALDPNNRSLEVRLENQVTFGRYLADKPFGGGIGTAGFWGARFNPNSLMANTATDSWYVKIWAETGIVGLAIHLSFLGFVLGKGGAVCMGLTDPKRKSYAMAIYASIVGVIFSSYGNQVFGQMPTGMIMNLAIPFLFLIPTWYENNTKK
ncbi:O-antigen ligase family protein [Algoriphagus taiwanensis]|uniref:O-antigen ligase family protein n=1 Tax=Algoriphagus taiwanensis TaxID=1445656 RepID=A0ABQ6Q1Q0_9BACT|nr:O-antigen ligase family protein [Algoriphagus taiwanensis]